MYVRMEGNVQSAAQTFNQGKSGSLSWDSDSAIGKRRLRVKRMIHFGGWISYFFISVMKYHDQGNFLSSLFGDYGSRGITVYHYSSRKEWQQAGLRQERVYNSTHSCKQRKQAEDGVWLLKHPSLSLVTHFLQQGHLYASPNSSTNCKTSIQRLIHSNVWKHLTSTSKEVKDRREVRRICRYFRT